MTEGEIVGLVGTGLAVGGVLVQAGLTLGKLAALDARVSRLEEGNKDQGQRLGRIDRVLERLNTLTGAHGVPITARAPRKPEAEEEDT